MKEQKTNVMRLLEQKKIPYQARHYPHGEEAVDGLTVARSLGQDPGTVYKTLVARGSKGGCYVFLIPVTGELDLKKAARAVGEKSVTKVPVKELLGLTGYVRGGCSPVGMKKLFPTTFHSAALELEAIAVSAGRIGDQVVADPKQLCKLVRGQFADLLTTERS